MNRACHLEHLSRDTAYALGLEMVISGFFLGKTSLPLSHCPHEVTILYGVSILLRFCPDLPVDNTLWSITCSIVCVLLSKEVRLLWVRCHRAHLYHYVLRNS